MPDPSEPAVISRPRVLVKRAPVMLETGGWHDYALLDSGKGFKLERYGAYRITRPEPQALWTPRLSPAEWESADAHFVGMGEDEQEARRPPRVSPKASPRTGFGPTGKEAADGRWRYKQRLAETWPIDYDGIRFFGRFTAFRHVGVFPEQATHWEWMKGLIERASRPLKVLHLFAYTGIASLIAARAGAEVTHIDASKKAIGWARENQTLAGLTGLPIRWICEDAAKFVERQVRRGGRYDAIILDPPKFGRGPNGEVWDIFTDLPKMMRACRALLSNDPLFLILTAYSIRASFLSIHELAAEWLEGAGGLLESGELVLREQAGGRSLSTSLFSRWAANG